MNELNALFDSEPDELLAMLPGFQLKQVNELRSQGKDYLTIADGFLGATASFNVGFGGDSNKPNLYREALVKELERFVCGDKRYKKERDQLAASANKSKEYIAGVISGAIGAYIGAVAVVIFPVIVLVIINFGRVSVNAWCEMRQAQSGSSETE